MYTISDNVKIKIIKFYNNVFNYQKCIDQLLNSTKKVIFLIKEARSVLMFLNFVILGIIRNTVLLYSQHFGETLT